ncbi:MAG: UbiD family decarboxylase [Syntrophorhabdaceae bacterium]|nr:UbiD family decarboxylase [Syntrophorhabdaceae bacterium]MDD5243984.1 UbiD family decarboxylase [Syntrophorhabdaceae bacterium]
MENKSRREFIKFAGISGSVLMAGLLDRHGLAQAETANVSKIREISSYKAGGIRDFIKLLDKNGELARIKKEVDPQYEIGSILKEYERRGKAVLFEKVKGSKIPAVGGLYQNWRRIGLALGHAEKFGQPEMYNLFSAAMAKPIPPVQVEACPWKDVILKGAKADITKFPVPTLFADDGGPYITAGVGICRNPETNAYNVGVYRMQVLGPDRILVWAFPGSDLHYIYKAYEKMGEELDFAVLIGADPAVFAAAVSKIPPEIDELAVAGALRGKGIGVAQCETVNLSVPAISEIVIEGKINPKARTKDGPFADHGGIYKGGPSPTMRISAICHRKNPLFQVLLAGDSNEHCTTSEILACFWGRDILDDLQSKFKNVKDAILYWRGGTKKWLVVSLSDKKSDKEPQEILTEIFSFNGSKYRTMPVSSFLRSAIIVNEDVDIYDIEEVVWAVGTRLANCYPIEADKSKRYELRVGFDATKPVGAPPALNKRTKTKANKL